MIKVYLDGQDITNTLNSQYPLPDSTGGGVFPSRETGKWYDLLACVDKNETLRKNFFNASGSYGGVHELKIEDPDGAVFNVKVLVRNKYSARNH